MAKIYILYTNGKEEYRQYDDFIKALEEQRKLLKNKKFMANVNTLQVKAQ